MRIIAGKFKSKKIIQPLDKATRPLKDITKESIFNIILHSKSVRVNLENANILDVFSGSGSFGLECISRGAKNVVFCENYEPAINVLKKNIKNFDCLNNTEIIIQDIFKILIEENKINKKFNIIFLDPPFKEKKIYELLDLIGKANILEKNGVIIIHRNKNYKDIFPDYFKIEIERSYGLSKVFFLKI